MFWTYMVLFGLLAMTVGCQNDAALSEDQLRGKALEIVKSSVILDGHIDVPYRLVELMLDVSEATDGGDFD